MAAFDSTKGPVVAWGGTFSANPLTMAAGLAALQAYDSETTNQLNDVGNHLRSRLAEAGVRLNGKGSLMRIMEDVDVKRLWWALYRRGVFAGANALLSLSTAMSEADLEFAGNAIVDAVHAIRT